MSASASPETSALSRRGFFARLGAGAAALTVLPHLAGCDSEDPDPTGDVVTLDFSDDFGVLNYAYALEQLEYAFYLEVSQGAYFQGLGASDETRVILDDLRKHEKAHVDFLRAAIPALGGTLIPNLTPNFSSIDFSDRDSVLEAAVLFEDTGVSAYNGAGQYLRDSGLLTIAGKIVSVEARHAAAVRDVLLGGAAFAGDDVVDPETGLDLVATPSQVLSAAGAFIMDDLRLTNVPS
jgi:rubrerythrin